MNRRRDSRFASHKVRRLHVKYNCKPATAQANETACPHIRHHQSQHAIPTSSIAKRPDNACYEGRLKRSCERKKKNDLMT